MDGLDWTAIGQVAGQGTTTTPHSYQWLHQGVPAGRHYYRLQQVDFDGRSSRSPIETVYLANGVSLAAWPNPASDVLYLPNVEGLAELIDITGRRVASVQLPQATWDIRDIPSGTYLLRIVAGESVATQQWVIY